MKKIVLFNIVAFLCCSIFSLNAQGSCVPNSTPCTSAASVSDFGGLCDTIIPPGRVGTLYDDNIQFYIEGICFDPAANGIASPIAGVNGRITKIDSVVFDSLPAGMVGGTNAPSYTIPQNAIVTGCGFYYGTPTEAGVFNTKAIITADAIACFFIPVALDDNVVPFDIELRILPNAEFNTLASSYCTNDGAVTLSLTPTSTTGGTFSGPGVSGTTFDPALAGVGTHTIKYEVTAQEGTAIAPTTDSTTQQVTVTSSYTYYADNDADGFGSEVDSIIICSATTPAGYVTDNTDCDDSEGDSYPGAPELCDGLDNNCDGQVDEGLTLNTYYADTDSDNYGDPLNTTEVCATSPPTGFVVDNTDCDDTNGAINPGATDIPGNSIDEDCDGSDATVVIDNDGDSFDNTVDCNDNDNTIYPGAPELCDGLDNNCDGQVDEGLTLNTYYGDTDSDNFGDPLNTISVCATTPPAGYVSDNTDCDDSDDTVYPGAPELCDGLDNNCDNQIDEGLTQFVFYLDSDFDGFGNATDSLVKCSPNTPTGYSTFNTDCNDNNININPDAIEICDGVDNNCDGQVDEGLLNTYYEDLDNDGFGTNNDSTMVCATTAPNGFADNTDDCDDSKSSVYPGAPELCDGLDNNCDGQVDEGLALNTFYVDADSDGFGIDDGNSITDCSNNAPNGYSANNTDCDDSDDSIYPGATEIADDGIDQDCDPATVAIRDVKADLNVSIYPNPTKNILNVEFGTEEAVNVQLFDMNGKQVYQNNVEQNVIIDMTTLNNGVYLIKITNENGAYAVQKVMKAK